MADTGPSSSLREKMFGKRKKPDVHLPYEGSAPQRRGVPKPLTQEEKIASGAKKLHEVVSRSRNRSK
jgi:hypothetical protein